MQNLKKTPSEDATCLVSTSIGMVSRIQNERNQTTIASTRASQPEPKIAILLCTYQGQKYLADQLNSIESQTYKNWQVWASDDASHDKTWGILESYKKKWGEKSLTLHIGPSRGFAENFMSMIFKADIVAEFYAYSDQDDIWEIDKLKRATAWLASVADDTPALYCSRTQLVDASDNSVGYSPLFTRPPSFANALMQNIGGGNTMVFNNAARKLLAQSSKGLRVITHDWWTYLVVTGCGGRVFYDDKPSLRYRQHGNNVVGMNSTWRARNARIRMLWQGRFKSWNDINIQLLQEMRSSLTPENLKILDQYAESRNLSLIPRLVGFKRSGIHRQTLLSNLGLIVGAIFNKV